jgi:hypothetical protein
MSSIWCLRIAGDLAENIEETIACCHRALTVLTRYGDPDSFSMSKVSLGVCCLSRCAGDRKRNMEHVRYSFAALMNVSSAKGQSLNFFLRRARVACSTVVPWIS